MTTLALTQPRFFASPHRVTAPAQSDYDVLNPVTGHRATRLAGAEGGGEPVRFEFTLPAHTTGAPWHFHTRFTETFTVVSGQLSMEVGKRGLAQIVSAGESVTVPRGTPHSFRNASAERVVFRCEVTPGQSFDRFIRVLYGLALEGRVNAAGMPVNFWHTVLVLHFGDVRVPGVPLVLQKLLLGGLVRLARRAGPERELEACLNRTLRAPASAA